MDLEEQQPIETEASIRARATSATQMSDFGLNFPIALPSIATIGSIGRLALGVAGSGGRATSAASYKSEQLDLDSAHFQIEAYSAVQILPKSLEYDMGDTHWVTY